MRGSEVQTSISDSPVWVTICSNRIQTAKLLCTLLRFPRLCMAMATNAIQAWDAAWTISIDPSTAAQKVSMGSSMDVPVKSGMEACSGVLLSAFVRSCQWDARRVGQWFRYGKCFAMCPWQQQQQQQDGHEQWELLQKTVWEFMDPETRTISASLEIHFVVFFISATASNQSSNVFFKPRAPSAAHSHETSRSLKILFRSF